MLTLGDWKRVFIASSTGHRLACYVLGADHSPTAILSSGIGCGPVFLQQIARELARDRRVIYWDYRGHGLSGTPPAHSGYSITDHAQDLQDVVQAFVTSRPPLMVGFSMGVQVTVEWARHHPDCAAGFILMLGVPRNPLHRTIVLRKPAALVLDHLAAGARPLLSLVQPAVQRALRTPLTYACARGLGLIQKRCPSRKFIEFIRFATDVPLDAYLRCAAGLIAHNGVDAFAQIRQPVLMLAAKQDVFIDADECRRFASRLTNGAFIEIADGSHAGSIEHGAAIARSIRLFLQEQESSRLRCAA